MSEYYKKYLKYKNKYINLQKQIGGNSFDEIVRRISNFMSSIVVPLNNSYIGFNYEFSQDDNKKSFAKSCDSYTNSPEVDKIRFVKWLNEKYTKEDQIYILRNNPIFFLFYIKIIAYIINNEPTDDIKEHIKIIIDNSRQLIKKLKLELKSSYFNKFEKIANKQIFDKATEDLIQLKLQMLELSIDNPEHPGHKSNPFHDLYLKLYWGKFKEADAKYTSLDTSAKKNFDSIHKQLRLSEMSIYIRFLLYKENYNEAITFVIDLDPDILNELKNKFNSIQGKTPHETSFYNYIDFLTSHAGINDSELSFHTEQVEKTPKEIKIMLDTFIGNKQFDEARKLIYSLNRLIKIDILRLMANSRPETIRMYKEILILDDLFLLFEDDIYGP